MTFESHMHISAYFLHIFAHLCIFSNGFFEYILDCIYVHIFAYNCIYIAYICISMNVHIRACYCIFLLHIFVYNCIFRAYFLLHIFVHVHISFCIFLHIFVYICIFLIAYFGIFLNCIYTYINTYFAEFVHISDISDISHTRTFPGPIQHSSFVHRRLRQSFQSLSG